MKIFPTSKRICVDMDEVMADAVAEHLLRYNRDFANKLHQITGTDPNTRRYISKPQSHIA